MPSPRSNFCTARTRSIRNHVLDRNFHQPHPHRSTCLAYDSRSADVCTGPFALPSQLNSKTEQTIEHRGIHESTGYQPWIKLAEEMCTPTSKSYSTWVMNSLYFYQIRLEATMHSSPEQDSPTVDYPKRRKKHRRCTCSHCPPELTAAMAIRSWAHLLLSDCNPVYL
jgi:hypothetical protein